LFSAPLNAFSRFTGLSWEERRIVLSAMGSMVAAMIVMRSGGLRLALSLVRRGAGRRRDNTKVGARRLGTMIHATADWLPLESSCLERSVALAWMLVRRGHACALVVESAAMPPSFHAHAWVDTADGAIGQRRDAPAVEIARWNLSASPQ